MSDHYEILKRLAEEMDWDAFAKTCRAGLEKVSQRLADRDIPALPFRLLVIRRMLQTAEKGFLVLPPLEKGGRGLVVCRPEKVNALPNLIRFWSDKLGLRPGDWDTAVTR